LTRPRNKISYIHQRYLTLFEVSKTMTSKAKATHANIEATQGPSFGGGYRVWIKDGDRVLATKHFPVPKSHRNWKQLPAGIELAYQAAKQYCFSFGVE